MKRRMFLIVALPLAGIAAETRAEMAKRQRKRREDDEWEWRHKYEEQWKAFLAGEGVSYKRWNYAKREEKRRFQDYREKKGLKPVPSRFLY